MVSVAAPCAAATSNAAPSVSLRQRPAQAGSGAASRGTGRKRRATWLTSPAIAPPSCLSRIHREGLRETAQPSPASTSCSAAPRKLTRPCASSIQNGAPSSATKSPSG
jgi:hypothetical protein